MHFTSAAAGLPAAGPAVPAAALGLVPLQRGFRLLASPEKISARSTCRPHPKNFREQMVPGSKLRA